MINKLKQTIVFWYNSIHNYITLYNLKKKAIMLHKSTGFQFHIVPADKEKLIIVSKNYSVPNVCMSIRAYNKAVKGKQRQLTMVDVLRMSYFSTPVQSRILK